MIRARKRFGQHFLEPAWVAKVIRAIDPKPGETFIEIGAGRGALTRPLAASARSVTAFEIDRDLAADLRERAPANLTIVEADFLDVTNENFVGADRRVRPGADPSTARPEPFDSTLILSLSKDERLAQDRPVEGRALRAGTSVGPYTLRVVGNLPYNVASPILFKLVDLHHNGLSIVDATVMLQREVADRLVAEPSTKEYGVLSVLLRHSAHVERLLNLPPGAFRPAPKIHSSVVRLRFHEPEPPVLDSRLFATLVQAVFTRRRKMLANALAAFEDRGSLRRQQALYEAGIDGSRRPETLTIAEFARLADVYRRSSREG